MRIADIISWPAVTVSPAHTVADTCRLLDAGGSHHLPVLSGGEVAGMLCICDLRLALPRDRVASWMSPRAISIDGAAPVEAALVSMDEFRINALPVPWRGSWGIVTRGDLARAGLCERQSCMACGSTHHVRRHDRGAMWFCLDCLDPRDEALSPYRDVGIGD